MKAIMISIKPEWVEKILNREKTIEIRKTMPKCELPCKVYIYCTKPKKWWAFSNWGATSDELVWKIKDKVKMCNGLEVWDDDCEKLNGKVVVEFTLNAVECFTTDYRRDVEQTTRILEKACSNCVDAMEYEENKPCLYAWHIEDLKIYDKPKELSSFTVCKVALDCGYDNCNIYNKVLTRPPQSWCYVEEIK